MEYGFHCQIPRSCGIGCPILSQPVTLFLYKYRDKINIVLGHPNITDVCKKLTNAFVEM